MKAIFRSWKLHYAAATSISLIMLTMVALVVGMVGCDAPTAGVQIRDWYDLDTVRDNVDGEFLLMNDLDSTTDGYEELASPTANEGQGWQPIGIWPNAFTGSFDGQGFEIRDLFIDRPVEDHVGLFSFVETGAVIVGVTVVDTDVTGNEYVGGLVGWNHEGVVSNSYSSGTVDGVSLVGGLTGSNRATVSNCYSTGNVTGLEYVGGLMGRNYQGTVSNSFWDTETSGQTASAGGTGKTTAEMQDIATFSGAEWNIITVASSSMRNSSYIWNIVDDETYPFLGWQPVV